MPDLVPIARPRNDDQMIGLPPRVVQDQNGIEACLSCAFSAAQEARSVREPPLAGAYHYRYANPSLDNRPVVVESAIQALASFGIASYESYFRQPLKGGRLTWLPGHARIDLVDQARQDGSSRRSLLRFPWHGPGLHRVDQSIGSSEMRRRLKEGRPSVIVFAQNTAYSDLARAEAGRPETYRLRNVDGPNASLIHAACVIGYIPAQEDFIVQDSRGERFGAGGQWLLPSRFVVGGFILRIYVWNTEVRS